MPEEIRTPEPTASLSFTDIFVGILSSPSEIFRSIVGTEPKTSHWAIPMILVMVIGIVFTMVVFTQPAIQDQMVDTQNKAMQKRVEEGKMTQEQMERAVESNPAKPGSPMFLIFGSIGVLVVTAFGMFVYPAVYFLAGKVVLKSDVSYTKVLETYGLTYYVSAVATLLSMVIVIAMGSIHASLSPALLLDQFDQFNTQHKLMASLNLLELWQLGVVAIGLSHVWRTTVGKAAGIVGGVWLVWTLVKVFVDFGF